MKSNLKRYDGKELESLIIKSKKAGMNVDTVIGDAAYSEKGNIEFANKNSRGHTKKSFRVFI